MSPLSYDPAARVALADRAIAHLLNDALADDIVALADAWRRQGRWPALPDGQLGALARATVAMALLDRGTTQLLREVKAVVDGGVPAATVSDAAMHAASAVHSRLRRSSLDRLTRMVEGPDAML